MSVSSPNTHDLTRTDNLVELCGKNWCQLWQSLWPLELKLGKILYLTSGTRMTLEGSSPYDWMSAEFRLPGLALRFLVHNGIWRRQIV